MPGPRRQYDRGELVDAAFRVLAERGADGLSVRAVASDLGLAPSALYTYVPSKQRLLAALVEELLDGIPGSAASTDDRTALLAILGELRRRLRAIRGAATLMMSAPLDGPHSLALNEALLARLTGCGLPLDDAARASYALQVYVIGFSALDAAERSPSEAAPDEARQIAERRAALDGWDVSAVPLTAQTADVVAAYNSTAQFEWGLERLLDGILRADSR